MGVSDDGRAEPSTAAPDARSTATRSSGRRVSYGTPLGLMIMIPVARSTPLTLPNDRVTSPLCRKGDVGGADLFPELVEAHDRPLQSAGCTGSEARRRREVAPWTGGRPATAGRHGSPARPRVDRFVDSVGPVDVVVRDGPTARAIASAAIAAIGIRSVVRPGTVDFAIGMSSKPTTDSSSGTFTPRSRAPRRTPIARTSVEATIAVGRGERRSSAPSAASPPSGVFATCWRYPGGIVAEDLRHRLGVGGLPLADVTEEPTADEGDPSMAQTAEMLDGDPRAETVVDLDARDQVEARPLPHRDDRDMGVAKVGEEARLIPHVAEQDDAVALARLEDGGQLEGLGRPGVREAEHDVVAARPSRARDGLDGSREERVGDVADDRPEEHRRRPAQRPCQRVRPVFEVARGSQDALTGLLCDRHGDRGVVQDPRDGAARDPGRDRDVLHRRRPATSGGIGSHVPAAAIGRLIARVCRRLRSVHRSLEAALEHGVDRDRDEDDRAVDEARVVVAQADGDEAGLDARRS